MSQIEAQKRVLSGMRPTGRLHLGHYHGVLKNWVRLQHEYDCFFFVADWHALTTHYEDPEIIEDSVWQMVIDWLASGVNPGSASLFIQSKVPEHAELHLMLSMITPLSWVERVPSYKDQLAKSNDRDLATYGFLGYPVLQSSDILIYQAGNVPVGADQVPHVEITREIARRFNHIFGRDPGFAEMAEEAIKKLGRKTSCNVCHVKGEDKKKVRNEYGNAISKYLKSKDFPKDWVKENPEEAKKKIVAGFKKANEHKSKDGKTFGEKIKANQLPATDAGLE